MERPAPRKRKPIRDNTLSEEIKDNIKNDAVITRLRSQNMKNKEIPVSNTTGSDKNSGSSDDESFENNISNPQRVKNIEKTKTKTEESKKKSSRRSSSGERVTRQSASPQYNFRESLPARRKSSNEKLSKKATVSEIFSEYNHKKTESSKTVSNITILKTLFAIGLISAVVTGYFFINGDNNINVEGLLGNFLSNKNKKNSEESVLTNVKIALSALKSKYKNQNKDLWQNAYFGITNLIKEKNKKPSIILLLGKNSDPVDCLAALLGNVSSNALGSDTLQLTPEKFDSNVGTVIESLRHLIKEKKVVVIWDLLNINTEALKAFHNLCDRINPLVEEVIYIITIISNDYNENMKPEQFIEEQLFKKLSGKMKDDAIQPLITRILDGPILSVRPEPTVTDCPLKLSK